MDAFWPLILCGFKISLKPLNIFANFFSTMWHLQYLLNEDFSPHSISANAMSILPPFQGLIL